MKTVTSYTIELWASNCPKCHAINAADHEPEHQMMCHQCKTRYLTKKADDGLKDD